MKVKDKVLLVTCRWRDWTGVGAPTRATGSIVVGIDRNPDAFKKQ